jgi:hypothetical protein
LAQSGSGAHGQAGQGNDGQIPIVDHFFDFIEVKAFVQHAYAKGQARKRSPTRSVAFCSQDRHHCYGSGPDFGARYLDIFLA